MQFAPLNKWRQTAFRVGGERERNFALYFRRQPAILDLQQAERNSRRVGFAGKNKAVGSTVIITPEFGNETVYLRADI